MGRILVFVDHDPSSKKAFKAAIHSFDKNADVLILVNIYSSWDYLNEDKNTGRLTLHEFKNYAETLGVYLFHLVKIAVYGPRFSIWKFQYF